VTTPVRVSMIVVMSSMVVLFHRLILLLLLKRLHTPERREKNACP
jgi:hypothetical protein